MSAIVYEYGCRAPTEGAERLTEQMSLAHRYHNRLIELEMTRRQACEDVLLHVERYAAAVARASALLAALLAAYERIARAKQSERRDVDTPAVDAEVRRLKRDLREARAERKAALAEAREAQASELEPINEAAAQARRDARATSGLYWGTYLIVEQAVQAACGSPVLHFQRWDGSGHVAVQVQRTRPLDTIGVFGSDSRVQLAPLPEPTEPRVARNGRTLAPRGSKQRERRPRYLLRVRVGSAEDRSPIWCALPVILHRPLPAGRIAWVHLLRERVEARDRYRVQFVIEPNELAVEPCGTGAVGVDIGWRVTQDGLRVAYAVGSNGTEHVLVQRPDVATALTHVEGLRSTRDSNLTALRSWLVAWLAGRDVPEWLAEARKTLPLWRSQARLAALALRWRAARWDGDAEGYERCEAWRRQDKHLWTWEIHERRRALGRRRERYRVWAAALARQYEVVVLERFDLREVAKQRPQEEDKDKQQTARYQRVVAATSILRSVLINAFRRRGGIALHAPAEYTTQRCHACGERCRWDQAAQLAHVCEHCGAAWDQDLNAARNLLGYASDELVRKHREALASAGPRIGRFQRTKKEEAVATATSSTKAVAEVDASGRHAG